MGTHHTSQRWFDLGVELFISRRRLTGRKTFPRALVPWALDSGGFTELTLYDEWRTTENEYVADVLRFRDSIGQLAWAAPQDWMCEPHMLEKTGLTIAEHQRRTIASFVSLRQRLGQVVIPVLQGWELDDYKRHWEMYDAAGVVLEQEEVVGLGSVCRRQNTSEVGEIVELLSSWGLGLHGFGVKKAGLVMYGDRLVSSDSMAWSFRARRSAPLSGCVSHKNCANCDLYAMRWRTQLLESIEKRGIAA